jgi:hypothetical protein
MNGHDSIFLYECGSSIGLYIRQAFFGRLHIFLFTFVSLFLVLSPFWPNAACACVSMACLRMRAVRRGCNFILNLRALHWIAMATREFFFFDFILC